MPRITVTATIPAGQSISNSVDLSLGDARFIYMPAGWNDAQLSFLISHNNVDFSDVVDITAREITLNIIPGTALKADLIPARASYLKFRSGSRANPIIQTVARSFIISADT